MELLDNLRLGFETALSLENLLFCFIGVVLGTAVGVLPGIGPTATIAMLLPITFNFEPVSALIMLAGIYYGAQYGGRTSAVMDVTTRDGNKKRFGGVASASPFSSSSARIRASTGSGRFPTLAPGIASTRRD